MARLLREPTHLILLSLVDAERHGYAIISEVEDLSDGRVTLGAGTLYGALDRLSSDGLVTATREEVIDGRNRRYYQLTEAGHTVLSADVAHRSALVDKAQLRLGPQLRTT